MAETETQRIVAHLDETHRRHLLYAINALLDSGEGDVDEIHDLFRAVKDADVIDFSPYQEKSRPLKGSPQGPESGT